MAFEQLGPRMTFNIHDAHQMPRIVPERLERLLNERDQLLNRLPPENLLEILKAGESRLIVDRGMALNAARSGVPVSSLATVFALLFPALLVAAIPLFIFLSWQAAALAALGSTIAYKASRHFTKEDVGRAALRDTRLLRLLMEKGVLWFEMADR
jgi:hypothetical protein